MSNTIVNKLKKDMMGNKIEEFTPLELKRLEMQKSMKQIKIIKIVRFTAYDRKHQEIFINYSDEEIKRIISDVCQTFILDEIIEAIPVSIRNSFIKNP